VPVQPQTPPPPARTRGRESTGKSGKSQLTVSGSSS
jgi:hypothetical protein